MALLTCTECKGPVSSKAEKCPKCGAPRQHDTSTVALGFAVLIGIGVAIAVLVSAVESWQQWWADRQSAKEEAALTPEQRYMRTVEAERVAAKAEAARVEQAAAKAQAEERTSAVYACRTFIRQRLKNPDSAKWVGYGDTTPVVKNKDGSFTSMLTLRATNSFGGIVPESYSCKVKPEGKDWHLLSLNEVRLGG